MGEYSRHGLVIFVEEQSPSLDFWEEGLERAPDSLQLLKGDVLEIVRAGQKPRASMQSLRTTPQPKPLESQCR